MYRKMIGMPNQPPDPDSDAAPMPRWVKLFGIAAGLFLLAFAVLHLTGRGLGHHLHGAHGSPHDGTGQP